MCLRLGVRLGSRIRAAGSGKLVLSEWINQSRLPCRLTGWCTPVVDDVPTGPAASLTVDNNPALVDETGSEAVPVAPALVGLAGS